MGLTYHWLSFKKFNVSNKMELFTMIKPQEESVRVFYSHVKSKADTCTLTKSGECGKGGGLCQISCTDYNHGWSCRRRHFQEIVGIPNIDKKFTNEQIQIIEARESERNASSSTSTIAAILAFKRQSINIYPNNNKGTSGILV
uniref:Uncharacterized protein n=1 Tax=Lepeophtheirus salmonis TaxID=72036 RepID=A0A0K2VBA0_LEPSM